jgi:hypothetical protein
MSAEVSARADKLEHLDATLAQEPCSAAHESFHIIGVRSNHNDPLDAIKR